MTTLNQIEYTLSNSNKSSNDNSLTARITDIRSLNNWGNT